jgi:hypothetical protein
MLLSIYLNDHLAGATAGLELARRSAARNRGSDYGTFLARLEQEVSEDRDSLLSIMRALGIRVDRLKVAAGWGAEKLGRLKFNGRLLRYSPLSRLVEFEALALGVHGKLAMWRSLQLLEPRQLASSGASLVELIARAERQLQELEVHRQRAVRDSLVSS